VACSIPNRFGVFFSDIGNLGLIQQRRTRVQEIDFFGVPWIGGHILFLFLRSALQVAKVL